MGVFNCLRFSLNNQKLFIFKDILFLYNQHRKWTRINSRMAWPSTKRHCRCSLWKWLSRPRRPRSALYWRQLNRFSVWRKLPSGYLIAWTNLVWRTRTFSSSLGQVAQEKEPCSRRWTELRWSSLRRATPRWRIPALARWRRRSFSWRQRVQLIPTCPMIMQSLATYTTRTHSSPKSCRMATIRTISRTSMERSSWTSRECLTRKVMTLTLRCI